jgi:hypothetical protein
MSVFAFIMVLVSECVHNVQMFGHAHPAAAVCLCISSVCTHRRLVQVLGSFGLSVALSKSAVLAGPALLFPIWGPWVRAGVRNVQVGVTGGSRVGVNRAQSWQRGPTASCQACGSGMYLWQQL